MKVIRSERKDRIVFHFNGSKVFWPSIVWLVDLRMLTGVCKTCLMAPPAIQRILLDNGPSKNSKDIWFLLIVASLQPVLSHALKGCFLFQVFFGRGSNQASLCHARFPLCRCNNRIVSPTMCKMFYTFRREKKHITKKTPIFLLVLFELPRTTKTDVFFQTSRYQPVTSRWPVDPPTDETPRNEDEHSDLRRAMSRSVAMFLSGDDEVQGNMWEWAMVSGVRYGCFRK